ncbi:TetR/AcrR family transcriptional regulator [Ramlibacter albus]|uniref:TetR/AcrR family transcriptional regulator n=1 Tax=Ramlibacter albus TaxID=2079448 RepID=A0A923MFB2_9BURK|nr:TetR/AcrR family transcriptional regulator [Ramlibacter albus]MBC5768493.1 TetR/AcrR family transcriptional regulator [Ramlibacter albus]
MATARSPHADSRLPRVLDEAARLFRTKGYEATSVRDIAKAAGILPGSLYSHFATKEDLLAAVYLRGVEQVTVAVQAAIDRHDDPWDRLEAACIAHLEAILRDDDYAQVVVRVRPSDGGSAQPRLVELRNRYESLWVDLVKALPLARGTDRGAYRLMLVGALNYSQTWYRADGRLNPRALARKFIGLLKQSQEEMS